MKLILTQEVTGLGAPGDVVEVKDGYGRNYLVPRGVAIRWTSGAEKTVESIKTARDVARGPRPRPRRPRSRPSSRPSRSASRSAPVRAAACSAPSPPPRSPTRSRSRPAARSTSARSRSATRSSRSAPTRCRSSCTTRCPPRWPSTSSPPDRPTHAPYEGRSSCGRDGPRSRLRTPSDAEGRADHANSSEDQGSSSTSQQVRRHISATTPAPNTSTGSGADRDETDPQELRARPPRRQSPGFGGPAAPAQCAEQRRRSRAAGRIATHTARPARPRCHRRRPGTTAHDDGAGHGGRPRAATSWLRGRHRAGCGRRAARAASRPGRRGRRTRRTRRAAR